MAAIQTSWRSNLIDEHTRHRSIRFDIVRFDRLHIAPMPENSELFRNVINTRRTRTHVSAIRIVHTSCVSVVDAARTITIVSRSRATLTLISDRGICRRFGDSFDCRVRRDDLSKHLI